MPKSLRADKLDWAENIATLFEQVTVAGVAPANFASLYKVEREFGVSLDTVVKSGMDLKDPENVLKVLKKGKVTYHFSPSAVAMLR